ncbi:DMT family transporter [Roseovarius sp.]|jgi:drug/metabolite transporter (DMT)-like permease|uniref:DMT family transporter n=1 Tax=Roseovarius sp. TaxID=1486281 RepID=UPI002623A7D4|nr:DMT family transporter [Roseovarius sp.]MDM8168396.1 DMT family transporter [Roseovarius sp.]
MNEHLKGLIITTLGVLFVVPDSLYVRLIDAEPMVTAFWRGMSAGGIILLGLLAVQGTKGFGQVLRSGWPGVIYMVLIGYTAPGFVLAVTHTSVANVVFIFASMPIFSAIFARVFLGEPISRRVVMTMLAVMAGLAIIAYGSGENEVAHWSGDLYALSVCIAYSGALTAVRGLKDISMIPAIPLAYIGAALLIWPFIEPGPPVEAQWHLFLGHGAFIAVATCFLTLGPRYISSPEVSLLILLESVLAPLLVWAIVGEDPGRWAMIGGAVVIGALLASNFVALRRRRVV